MAVTAAARPKRTGCRRRKPVIAAAPISDIANRLIADVSESNFPVTIVVGM